MKPRHPETLGVKATLLLVSTLTVMAGATIAPSLPAMRSHFAEVPNADYWVRLVLTVPALFIALGAPIAGTIIDRFGRKRWLALSVFAYGLAGSSGFFLNDIGWILVGRLVLGLSVAGIMTTATTLVADYYLGAARAQFLGVQAAFMALGGVLFLTLGGYLADISWRFPFLIYMTAWLMLPLVLLVLPEPVRVSRAEAQALAAANPEPVPWVLLFTTFAIALLTQIVFYMIPVQLPFYLQQLSGANGSQSGLAIALATLAAASSSLSYQKLKARFHLYRALRAGLWADGGGLPGDQPGVELWRSVGGAGDRGPRPGPLYPQYDRLPHVVDPSGPARTDFGRSHHQLFLWSVCIAAGEPAPQPAAGFSRYLWSGWGPHAAAGSHYLGCNGPLAKASSAPAPPLDAVHQSHAGAELATIPSGLALEGHP
ncbi:MFS transporter [Leptolyngbya sp. SLC-A1]|nr:MULTISPECIES: MFS transporter [Cyanophyceae]